MAGEITIPEVQARVPAETWSRVFDRDGSGTVDTNFVQQCIDDAVAEIEMRVEASLPGYLATKSAAVSNAIKRRLAAVVLYLGVQFNPAVAGATDKEPGPFSKPYKEALDFFDRLARDDENRPTDGALAQPQASIDNVTASNDGVTYNQPWTRAASGQDSSNF